MKTMRKTPRIFKTVSKTLLSRNHISAIGGIQSSVAECSAWTAAAATAVKENVEREIPQNEVRKTGLYDFHVSQGAKMVNFAGYYLPVRYGDTNINSSHLHTRSNCSLFDVSHMAQTYIRGRNAIEFLESVCVTDIAGMKNGRSSLSLFTHELTGGIIDDFIVTKISDNELFLVTNASRRTVDKRLLSQKLSEFYDNGKEVRIEFVHTDEQSLIALQGPQTASVLQPFVNINMAQLTFMNSEIVNICGIENCRITRCGYTGEDGVEISVPTDNVENVVRAILQNEFVKMAGLAVRDTLRLEAGLCLHGSDIDERTTPIEAGLKWTISKRRLIEENFPGSQVIMRQIREGIEKQRVGIMRTGNGGPVVRGGNDVVAFDDDDIIGFVTSGCPSPSLKTNIGIAYVKVPYAKVGTQIRLKIRNNLYEARIAKMPFIQTHYYNSQR